MKTALRLSVIALLVAIVSVVTFTYAPASKASAQSYGPMTYRDSGGGMVLNNALCFESGPMAGQDLCIKRTAAGHVNILNGFLGANADVVGTCTAVTATTCVVTFITAYTAAPVCVVTDQTTAANNALKATPTTTTLTITTTSSSDKFSYLCLGT